MITFDDVIKENIKEQKLLLNTQIIWIVFMKTLKNTTQIKNVKYSLFYGIIADMLSNKKLNSMVTELFFRVRKLNIFLAFITQSYFEVSKDVRLNTRHFLIMKIPNERELQQIMYNQTFISY